MKTIGILFMFSWAYGQEAITPDSLNDFQEVAESYLLEVAPEGDEAESGEPLIHLSENPLDLNSAGWKELQQIPGVSPLIAYRIVSARRAGNFSHVRELLLLEGIDEALYQRMLPFVTVKSFRLVSSIHIRTRLQSDLQSRQGFLRGAYAGEKQKYYLRTSLEQSLSPSTRLDGNITVEKDPGEMAAEGFRSGFLSASVGLFELTAGDFVVSSGNGHVLARGAEMGRRMGRTLRRVPAVSGYQSADEQRFFRGVAIAGVQAAISFGAFYSNKSLHGTLQNDGSVRLDNSGLFRTASERSRRNVARERVVGGYLSMDLEDFTVGITGYDARVLGPSPHRSIGVDASWKGERWLLAGSLAREHSGGSSFSSIIILDPWDGWNVFTVHESFTHGFSARHALARVPVPASLSAVGVRGWVARWNTLSVSAYAEHFPQGKQGDGFSEYEVGARLESSFPISRSFQIDVRAAARNSPVKIDSRDPLGRTISVWTMQAVRKYSVVITSGRRGPLGWISRAEVVKTSLEDQTDLGFMVSQELRYAASDRLRVVAKLMIFSIQDYDARIFSFESQVPGVLVSRVLTGDGTRSTLSVLWRVTSIIGLSASFSTEVKDGQRFIGSGFEEIPGDTYSRFTVQMDVHF